MTAPLDADALEELLEDILWAEASSKRSSTEALAQISRLTARWAQPPPGEPGLSQMILALLGR